ncbi:Rv3654c family TadE-like protein [Thalassiella azotivora]
MTGVGAVGRLRAWRGDTGSGTVLVVGVVAALGIVLASLVGLVSVVSARHGAQAASDLAALAAADVSTGRRPGDPCAVAAAVSGRNGAALAGCRVDGADVHVQVEVRPAGLAGALGPARARATAGPAP